MRCALDILLQVLATSFGKRRCSSLQAQSSKKCNVIENIESLSANAKKEIEVACGVRCSAAGQVA